MRATSIVLGLLVLLPCIYSLKFLAYNPIMGASHAAFINKIAEILHDDGHEIIMLSPPMSGLVKVTYPRNWTVISIAMPAADMAEAAAEGVKACELYWNYRNVFDFVQIVESVTTAGVKQCDAVLRHPGLIESLRAHNFDAAFAEPVDYCGFGLFRLLGIRSYAATMTIPSTDNTFEMTGLPAMTSFVPGMASSSGDDMSLYERLTNTITVALIGHYTRKQQRKYQATFERIDPAFPRMEDIVSNASLFLVNSDVVSDFPRLSTPKIVEAGGITLLSTNATVDEHWSSVLSLRPHTVLLSFGTVARSASMPPAYKKAIREAFARFPEITFIWKYEDASHGISKGVENIVEATFVPQKELFKDARLSAFITHGGAGSMVEFLHAGVPTIVVPLAGEQSRSGPLVERLGSGLRVLRTSLGDPDALADAIRNVVYKPEYKQAAVRVAARLRDQPFTARERVLRNMVFMARHGPLHFLNHRGMQLNWLSYHSIDVYCVILLIGLATLSAAYLLLFISFRAIVRAVRKHIEKKRQ